MFAPARADTMAIRDGRSKLLAAMLKMIFYQAFSPYKHTLRSLYDMSTHWVGSQLLTISVTHKLKRWFWYDGGWSSAVGMLHVRISGPSWQVYIYICSTLIERLLVPLAKAKVLTYPEKSVIGECFLLQRQPLSRFLRRRYVYLFLLIKCNGKIFAVKCTWPRESFYVVCMYVCTNMTQFVCRYTLYAWTSICCHRIHTETM